MARFFGEHGENRMMVLLHPEDVARVKRLTGIDLMDYERYDATVAELAREDVFVKVLTAIVQPQLTQRGLGEPWLRRQLVRTLPNGRTVLEDAQDAFGSEWCDRLQLHLQAVMRDLTRHSDDWTVDDDNE